MMLHAQALVETRRPSAIAAAMATQLGMEFATEWSAEAGSIALPDGICDMHAWPEGLRLDAYAASSAALERVEHVVAQQIERAAGDPPPAVAWRRRPGS